MNRDKNSFPKDFFVEIKNNPNHLARIVVGRDHRGFNSQIDIVFSESRKIFIHVGDLYEISDEEECVKLSRLKLAKFLNPPAK